MLVVLVLALGGCGGVVQSEVEHKIDKIQRTVTKELRERQRVERSLIRVCRVRLEATRDWKLFDRFPCNKIPFTHLPPDFAEALAIMTWFQSPPFPGETP